MTTLTCSVFECETTAHALGFCRKHYQRFKRHGDPQVVKAGGVTPKPKQPSSHPPKKKFWEKVNKSVPEGCWEWTGALNNGYGWHGGKLAHRTSYQEIVGTIPEGLDLDHLCRNPPCINPAHLEPVTRTENMRRRFVLQTHCKNGHEFTEDNTHLRGGIHRSCRKCAAAASKRYAERKKLEAA